MKKEQEQKAAEKPQLLPTESTLMGPTIQEVKSGVPGPVSIKGRHKIPTFVDYDRQCGVMTDRNLPCSRSLTCKSHSIGAKRAVPDRSKPYDELLLEWHWTNNPKFVETVKKERKRGKKEAKEG